jgi:hypothetical protein
MAIFQKDALKEAPRAAAETIPTQLIPYPTGATPDQERAYREANPDRFVDWSTTAPTAKKGK